MTKEKTEYTHIFDDVFRTMEEHVPELLIPLINEVFGTNYPPDVKITRLGDRHHRFGKSKETDSALSIGSKIYHIECESNPESGVIAIRMFEYDISVALDNVKKEKDVYIVEFPVSCVIYLRHHRNTKSEERVIVRMPDGREIDYVVPVIKSQEYTKEDIFEKKLYLLLPYYILKYERQLPQMEKDEKKREILLEEYRELQQKLIDDLALEEPQVYSEIYKLTMRVLDYTLQKNQTIRKGVDQIMGGKVLESYREQVIRENLEELVRDGLLTIEVAAERIGMTVEEFQSLLEQKQ